MKKDKRSVLTEYVRNLSEDELKFLGTRLIERLSSDLAEALNVVSNNKNADEVFRNAGSAAELYDLLDDLRDCIIKECKKRNINPSRGKNSVAA